MEAPAISRVSNSNDGNIPSTVNAFNYSTEETRIGAWIDGSPLYQIVFTDMFNVTSTTITNASVGFSFPELNIEAIVKVDALMYNTKAVSRGIRIFPYYNTSSYGIIGSGSRSSPNAINVTIYSTSTDENGDVKPILSNISNINDNKVIVIMQYIKKIADN